MTGNTCKLIDLMYRKVFKISYQENMLKFMSSCFSLILCFCTKLSDTIMDRVSFKKYGPRGHSTIRYERFDDNFSNGK